MKSLNLVRDKKKAGRTLLKGRVVVNSKLYWFLMHATLFSEMNDFYLVISS